MSTKVPKLKFNNGKEIPILGFGMYVPEPGKTLDSQVVKDAIDIGYRHFDGAYVYENEKEVGIAIMEKIREGVVTREDLFITSKLWNTCMKPELVEAALKTSLSNLNLEYVDLYLIHSPTACKEGSELMPMNPDGSVQFSDVDYVDTWKAMEAVNRKGLAKSIGVSNFNSKQIERVLKIAEIKPVVNQVECHPYLDQSKLSRLCRSKNILIAAYSPLGAPARPWAKPEDPHLLGDAKLKKLAKKYNKTAAQILIRYQIELGHIVLVKSLTKSRIAENFDVFDFNLTPEDIEYMKSFDRNGRYYLFDVWLDHPHYPFKIPF